MLLGKVETIPWEVKCEPCVHLLRRAEHRHLLVRHDGEAQVLMVHPHE